jgi:hypothetical protein
LKITDIISENYGCADLRYGCSTDTEVENAVAQQRSENSRYEIRTEYLKRSIYLLSFTFCLDPNMRPSVSVPPYSRLRFRQRWNVLRDDAAADELAATEAASGSPMKFASTTYSAKILVFFLALLVHRLFKKIQPTSAAVEWNVWVMMSGGSR